MHLGCNVFVEIKGEYLGNRGFLLYQLGKVEQVRACVGKFFFYFLTWKKWLRGVYIHMLKRTHTHSNIQITNYMIHNKIFI